MVQLEKKASLCFCGETEKQDMETNFESENEKNKRREAFSIKQGVLLFPRCGKVIITSYESSPSLTPSLQKRDSHFSQK